MNFRMSCDWPRLGRTVLATTLISACFPVIYFTYGGHVTIVSALLNFLVPWIFANCVAIPANLIPWKWLETRNLSVVARWATRIGVLLCLGFVGTALGSAILVLLGLIPLKSLGRFYVNDLPIVLV